MLLADARVLDRHLPARERHELRSGRRVTAVQSSVLQGLGGRGHRPAEASNGTSGGGRSGRARDATDLPGIGASLLVPDRIWGVHGAPDRVSREAGKAWRAGAPAGREIPEVGTWLRLRSPGGASARPSRPTTSGTRSTRPRTARSSPPAKPPTPLRAPRTARR